MKVNEHAIPLISKENFRCRGRALSLPKTKGSEVTFDCDGINSHSLPIKDAKEFVDASLIEIFNELQSLLVAKVTIIEGHRCGKHNLYVDASYKNSFSKHQIGARATFVVAGHDPIHVLETLMKIFAQKGQPLCARNGGYANKYMFFRIITNALTNEGEDKCLCVELLFDKVENKRVEYSYQKAHKQLYYY